MGWELRRGPGPSSDRPERGPRATGGHSGFLATGDELGACRTSRRRLVDDQRSSAAEPGVRVRGVAPPRRATWQHPGEGGPSELLTRGDMCRVHADRALGRWLDDRCGRRRGVGGGERCVELSASQAVAAYTEVELIRDADSNASLEDYKLAPPPLITIMMGDTSGSLTLTATGRRRRGGRRGPGAERPGGGRPAAVQVIADITDNDMITYTLSGPADVNIAEGKSAVLTATASSAMQVDLWDAAVPVLPAIAQVLLAMLPGVGGYRHCLHRR